MSMTYSTTPADQTSAALPEYWSAKSTSGATYSGVPQAVLQIESMVSSLLNLH